MIELALALINLHEPDGRIVQISPAQIVTLRRAGKVHRGHYHNSVRCLVYTTDGKHTPVLEECEQVNHMIGGEEVPP